MTNVGLTDRTALMLAEAVEKNSTLRVLNIETNFISPQVVVVLVKGLLQNMSVEEFRASNQVSWLDPAVNFKFGVKRRVKLIGHDRRLYSCL